MNKRWMQILREENVEAEGGGDELPPPPPQPDPELQQLKERLARAETAIRNQPVPTPPAAPIPAGPDKAELLKEFYKDPLEMTARIAQAAAQNAAGQAVHHMQQSQGDLLMQQARETARKSDPELFDVLEIHINAKLQDIPVQYKNNPTVWVNCFNTVKGEHIDKVMEHRTKKGQQVPTPSSDGPARPSHRQAPAPKEPELTGEEKRIAQKMRLTEDQYKHGKKLYENQDLMWKGNITFDSQYEPRTADKKEKANV